MYDEHINTAYSAAMHYASRGWRVAPALRGRKYPSVPEWEKRATTDGGQIAEWFGVEPLANVCIATGEESNLWVLDIDEKGDAGGSETLYELERLYGARPWTYAVGTPSGGVHLYFTWEGVDFDLRNSAGALGRGLDVRANGGQVVAPPSVTDVGKYIILANLAVAPAPRWLIELLRPVRQKAERHDSWRDWNGAEQ